MNKTHKKNEPQMSTDKHRNMVFQSKIKNQKSKILSPPALSRHIKSIRRSKKVVFTNGCFDLVHSGHVKVMEYAKKHGDILIVAVNSDVSVKSIKGPKRPLLPLRERALLMAALKPVDYVTFFHEDTPSKAIQILKPDVLVKGGDWSSDNIVGREFVKKVVRIPLVKGRSTTHIVQTILKRYQK